MSKRLPAVYRFSVVQQYDHPIVDVNDGMKGAMGRAREMRRDLRKQLEALGFTIVSDGFDFFPDKVFDSADQPPDLT